jgi:hypothetical protein
VLTIPPHKKILDTKPHKKTRRPRLFKNCRATEEEEEGGRRKETYTYINMYKKNRQDERLPELLICSVGETFTKAFNFRF